MAKRNGSIQKMNMSSSGAGAGTGAGPGAGAGAKAKTAAAPKRAPFRLTMSSMFGLTFIAIWAALCLLNVAVPKKDFSESENRVLTSFPSFTVKKLFAGTFMQKVDEYINDHFVGRDTWITMKAYSEYALGKRENNGVFIARDRLIEDILPPDEAIVEKNIADLRNYAAVYGKPSYLMLVPSASAIQADRLPLFARTWDQKGFIDGVNEQLADSGIAPIKVYDALSAHKDEYIYYRTDHHWTTDGALYAYREAAGVMGLLTLADRGMTSEVVTEDFRGTLDSKSGFRSVAADSIKVDQIGGANGMSILGANGTQDFKSIYFPEYLSKKDKYAYFLNGVQAVLTIRTQRSGGEEKKLLIFKDSYAHAFIPLILKDYTEITVVDLRYLNEDVDKVVDLADYDETLFLYSMDTFTHQANIAKLSYLE